MSLHVELGLSRGAFSLELAFDVAPAQVVAIVGPNGAGKSTLLEAIAGLLPLARGQIVLGERTLERAADRLRLPPQLRGVGMLFQGLALFEHQSALDNVAYGPRARGLDAASARTQAREWLARFGVAELADRRPSQLSGGQAQRVALARALIVEPELLLLDEPLAALDAATLEDVRELLRATLASFAGPCLIVSHALDDVLTLAERVLVIEDGKLIQDGPPAEILAAPATPHLAAMVRARAPLSPSSS